MAIIQLKQTFLAFFLPIFLLKPLYLLQNSSAKTLSESKGQFCQSAHICYTDTRPFLFILACWDSRKQVREIVQNSLNPSSLS